MNRCICLILALFCATPAWGAWYYGSYTDPVLPGEYVEISIEVMTEAGDNVVDVGYFSFALDMMVSGTAGLGADAVEDVSIATFLFDDLESSFTGEPQGEMYMGTAAATTDAFPPNFGSEIGEIVPLFSFRLEIPADAAIGETIDIELSEGVLLNVTAGLERVSPQSFEPIHLEVVPEPGTLAMLWATSVALGLRVRRYARSTDS
jgi:hypothetical protein